MFSTGSPEGENVKGCVFVWREAPLHNWLKPNNKFKIKSKITQWRT
jgi:hypothetical protein